MSVQGKHRGSTAPTEASEPATSPPVLRGPDGRFVRGSGRPPVRRPGGQPGNLSSAKHPYRAFYRRLALPKRYRWLLPLIEGRVAHLAADKGGAEHLTAGEAAMLDVYRRAHGASLLLLVEAHEHGYIRETKDGWDLHPGARELARFADLERRVLQTLGLERKAKPLPTLTEIMRQSVVSRDGSS